MDKTDIFLSRLDQLLAETALSDHKASMLATGKPDLIRKCRADHRRPSTDGMKSLAALFNVSTDFLYGLTDVRASAPTLQTDVALAEGLVPFRVGGPAQNLPVRGTALGHDLQFGENGTLMVEQTIMEVDDPIRYVTRPPSLIGVTTAYCLYIQGDSMSPRHDPGDLVVVDPRKPPAPGDDVIVQLIGEHNEDGDARVQCVLIKRLLRRSGSWTELEQFNPATRFRVENARVAAIHRIVRMSDMLGG